MGIHMHPCQLSSISNHRGRQPWDIAASILLALPNSVYYTLRNHIPIERFKQGDFPQDFSILLTQRPRGRLPFSAKLVFPGGILSKSDQVTKHWSSFPDFLSSLPSSSRNPPPVYHDLLDETPASCCSEWLHPAASLRICAIRELFEETGMLLIDGQQGSTTGTLGVDILLLSSDELQFWVPKLLKHPEELHTLYAHFNVRPPPLTDLYDWSNWLTPAHFLPRYDTVFFFAGVRSIYFTKGSDTTVENQKWRSSEVVKLFGDCPLSFLSPETASNEHFVVPQLYELGRLAQFSQFTRLVEFAKHRASLGMRRWCAVIETVENSEDSSQPDKIVFLPGDQRYAETACQAYCGNKPSLAEIVSDINRNRLLLSSAHEKQCPDSDTHTKHLHSSQWFDSSVYELGHVTPISQVEYFARFPNSQSRED